MAGLAVLGIGGGAMNNYCQLCSRKTLILREAPGWTLMICLTCYARLLKSMDESWEQAKAEYVARRGRA